MDCVEAKFSIVTPMFIGDGDSHTSSPQLRPPSIKGALRFWWRALRWYSLIEYFGDDSEAALKELHSQEATLFGSAADPNDARKGQSKVYLKLSEQSKTGGTISDWPQNNDGGSGYIGYGLDRTQESSHRYAIKQGEFTLQLILKNSVDEEQLQQLKDALKLWGMVGGLGSRSRRGFGSVAIQMLNGESCCFADENAYTTALSQLIKVVSQSNHIVYN
ncbi:type III-B CRISPR module RAMP protein Cmr1 [Ectothiorhodospiraceae bacterium BW-2]|nr:type III-B CRISPR module RAMP protein Cmr1 [Ectothiorhodospiraceae bacterium BW-2]